VKNHHKLGLDILNIIHHNDEYNFFRFSQMKQMRWTISPKPYEWGFWFVGWKHEDCCYWLMLWERKSICALVCNVKFLALNPICIATISKSIIFFIQDFEKMHSLCIKGVLELFGLMACIHTWSAIEYYLWWEETCQMVLTYKKLFPWQTCNTFLHFNRNTTCD
jgi:hypothetical protein